MTRTNILSLLIVTVGIGTALSTSVHSAGGFGTTVDLQASTPGTAQTGHINVTGTVLATKFSATNSTNPIYGEATGNNEAGVIGINMNSTYGEGVKGKANMSTGIGVYGEGANGLNGYGDPNTGVGVGATGKNAVSGVCSAGGKAIVGQCWDANSIAIYGYVNQSSSYAGYFNGKTFVSGMLGVGTQPGSAKLSVLGNEPDAMIVENNGTGRGMHVLAGSDTAIWAETNSGWAGVDGRTVSTSGAGVVGNAMASSGTNYGVLGYSASASGWGVYALGRLGASGTKPFRIDHPLDPANKYLYHYSSESPEPQNFYNGVVRTGARGEAWVQLPDYFESINRDFRYALTVVEDSDSDQFVVAKVARKIQGNRFKIRTNQPNVEVSWEVKAIRNDAWVQRYGAPESTSKEGREKGTYLHPELYEQPVETGTFYRPVASAPASKSGPTADTRTLTPIRPRGK